MSDKDDSVERSEDREDTAKLKAVLVMVATIAFVVTPFLSAPFTGFNPDQLPVPVTDPPVQPAGYAFSIWGVIYLWLLASAGFGMVKRDIDAAWDAGRWPLFVSVAIGASWISIALRSPVLATILIWVMMVTAVWALARAPKADRWWNALPLGLYAGWLTAASSVALATVAMGYGLFSPMLASWLGLGLALAVAWIVARWLPVASYPFGVGWALIGVTVANLSTAPALAIAAALGALIMAWLFYDSLRKPA